MSPEKFLALELGGTHFSCAAVEGRRVLESFDARITGAERLADLLGPIAQSFKTLESHHGAFAGLGVGFCGLVDTVASRISSTNGKYVDAEQLDFPAWARAELNLPLAIENDARLALMGEHNAGAAQDKSDVVMMTLGTGIGTAVMMHGRILRGKHSQAGILGGHIHSFNANRRCSCGSRGCYESEASTFALPGVCRNWPGFERSALAFEPKLNFQALFDWADRGDDISIAIRDHCIGVWSACAVSLVHAYDPEVLLIGGGVAQSSFPLAKSIQGYLDANAWTPWGKVEVRRATLNSNAALLGVVPLFASLALRLCAEKA